MSSGSPDIPIRRAHIVGLGRSGLAAAQLLLKRKWELVVSDDADSEELRKSALELSSQGIKVHLGGHGEALKQPVELAVTSPGVSWMAPMLEQRRQEGVEVISELELGWRHCRGKVVAVTGSNGKTTTTTLLGEIFKRSGRPGFTCGNIGTPLSAVADETTDDSLLTVEVSSYQLEGIVSFHPSVGVLLNITPDHLDRHGDLAGYARAKARLWRNQTGSDWLVYFADDPIVGGLVDEAPSRKFPFSIRERLGVGAWVENDELVVKTPAGEFRMPRSSFRMPGRHNSANALAAISAALLMGVEERAIRAAVTEFEGIPHRLELVREFDQVVWINDSKATNVDAGRWAVESVERPIILIAGGRAKGGGFRDLRDIAAGRLKRLILIGEAASDIRQDLGDLAPVEMANSLDQAVTLARKSAAPGDAVLLSPLCASFDMFRNYEDRGEQFKQLVINLK